MNLNKVARLCEYATGADLQALLYNAQLEAVHQSMAQLGQVGAEINASSKIKGAMSIFKIDNTALQQNVDFIEKVLNLQITEK